MRKVLSDECEPVSVTPAPPGDQAARRPRHSARAAARVCLWMLRFWGWRSDGKWLWTEAWTEANFCSVCIRRNRNIAPSRRRKGRCEFSARLLSQRPISRSSPRPGTSRMSDNDDSALQTQSALGRRSPKLQVSWQRFPSSFAMSR